MLSNKQLVAVCAIIFCCNMTLLVLFVKYHACERCFVTINEDQIVSNIVPDNFLSVGIDTSQVEDYESLNFLNSKFVDLASALSPARLRLGGTMSDRLIFSAQDQEAAPQTCEHCTESNLTHVCPAMKKLCKHKILPFFLLSGPKWIEINTFAQKVGFKLLFALNLLLRDHHSWDDRNARDLLTFSQENNFDIDWQLGNEPNSLPHVFNMSVPPRMLARDFKKLRKLLIETGYNQSLLVGPDTTRPQPQRPECLRYMVEFLGNGSNTINVRSWHQYYLNSRIAQLEDFWDPDTFDLLEQQILAMKESTENYSHIPMWLTETSSSYGGGAPELSNTFSSTPLWLDKLGLSAKHNITTVVRQSLFGGFYSMIDNNFNPLPDWWMSVLYKRLVGSKVLQIQYKCSRHQRMYAHCANRKYTNDTTAITLYAVNLEMAKARFIVNGTAIHGDDLMIDQYILSARSNYRQTKTLLLNGWPLTYDSKDPVMPPLKIKYGNHISMPPYSVGFWVIKNTSIKICG